MNTSQPEILSRLNRVEESFLLAQIAVERALWKYANAQLYYTCYHLVQALFMIDGLETSTHAGTHRMFNLHFIKSGRLSARWGTLLSHMFGERQGSEYDYEAIVGAEVVLKNAEKVVEFRKFVYEFLSIPLP